VTDGIVGWSFDEDTEGEQHGAALEYQSVDTIQGGLGDRDRIMRISKDLQGALYVSAVGVGEYWRRLEPFALLLVYQNVLASLPVGGIRKAAQTPERGRWPASKIPMPMPPASSVTACLGSTPCQGASASVSSTTRYMPFVSS
jgi:hypothetical protein